MPVVAGFLPSVAGFLFVNSFPSVPLEMISLLGRAIPLGDAANGLCGGMTFAACDYFRAGARVPADSTAPSSGALFDYLVKRQIASFLPPNGLERYVILMNPALPDQTTLLGTTPLPPHGRAWTMVNDEWPAIQADIDRGQPAPLGLVRVKSGRLADLRQNHQVLAYGYQLTGSELAISIYDPNWPQRDDIVLSLNIATPQHATPVSQSTGEPLICLFRSHYTFDSPPAAN